LTKQHRTSVAREKAEEAARLAKAAKRAAPTSSTADGAAGGEHDDNGEPEAKRARTGAGALPEGFFSKGNERSFSDDEDEQEAGDAAGKPTPAAEIPAKTGDAELDNFFASLAAPEEAAAPIQTEYSIKQATTGVKGKRAAYKEVIPGQASYEAAPVRNVAAAEEEKEPTPEPEETPAQRKERLAREEREEIMARLEEEERAQYVCALSPVQICLDLANATGRTQTLESPC
jgi:zinc finger protein 830